MHTKRKKDSSFSKRLLVIDYIISVILVIIAIIYAFVSDSYSSPITTMVDVWVGQLAVITAFYLWKSKCENRAKYAQDFYERMSKDENFNSEKADAAARFMEAITHD